MAGAETKAEAGTKRHAYYTNWLAGLTFDIKIFVHTVFLLQERTMQIGKYDVVANVTGSHEGGFKASVTRKWVEGGVLKELTHTLDDRIHSTMEQARDYAYEHARLQVVEGFW